ncbi:hypothetical protein ACYCFK_09595 [Stutzerimonas stutzeri]
MAKSSLTQASGITADLVLDVGKLYSSDELRSVQTKLTGTTREIRKLTTDTGLLGRLSASLSREQRQLLHDAAQLIDSVNTNITHAKERKKRSEEAKKKWRAQRDKEARWLVEKSFPLPLETYEQKLEIIKLAMVLHQLRIYQGFFSAQEFHLACRKDVTETPQFGWTPEKWKLHQVTHHRLYMLQELQSAITNEWDQQSVQEQHQNLQQRIADIRDQALADPLAVETLHIWAEALSPEATQGNRT